MSHCRAAVTPGSEALLAAFAEQGIAWHPNRSVSALNPARSVAVLDNGEELPYDLFLGVPVHKAAAVAEEIIVRFRGLPQPAPYGGNSICYAEFGSNRVGLVEVTFLEGNRPVAGACRDQGRVRLQSHPPLVRSRVEHILSPGSVDVVW